MEMIMPVVGWGAQITTKENNAMQVQGVTEVFPDIRDHPVVEGRFFTC